MDWEALARWALSGSTGASAEAIASNLAGLEHQSGDYPHDAGDFGRCESMMNAVPGFRLRLAEMASVNKYWAALVPEWDRIKSAPDAGRSDVIRSIIRPIQDADRAVVRLSDSVTMTSGRP